MLMRILGIETSCDETAVAVLEAQKGRFNVLSNIVSSQVKIHRKWGGVVPMLAKREHQKNLVPVLASALARARLLEKNARHKKVGYKELAVVKDILSREPELFKKTSDFLAEYKNPNINVISVTKGLGLEPALWVGINFAKALSFYWQKPILPINHIEAHLLVNFLRPPLVKVKYPAVCLMVSGGHTLLVLMRRIGEYKVLGETRDDTAGECFDKTARLLGLGYPGGPAIAKAANKAVARYQSQIKMPRPMIYSKNYDFSFSGLKTAVLYNYKSQPLRIRKSKNYIYAMAAEIQQAIIDVLIFKTMRAAKGYSVETLMIGGGVTANEELRRQSRKKVKKELPLVNYLEPDPALCTDNGVMTAIAGYFSFKRGVRASWQEIAAEGNMKI